MAGGSEFSIDFPCYAFVGAEGAIKSDLLRTFIIEGRPAYATILLSNGDWALALASSRGAAERFLEDWPPSIGQVLVAELMQGDLVEVLEYSQSFVQRIGFDPLLNGAVTTYKTSEVLRWLEGHPECNMPLAIKERMGIQRKEPERRDSTYNLSFPGFLIGAPNQPDSAYTLNADGAEWLLYYRSQEVAELYIEQASESLVPHPVADIQRLRDFLIGMPHVAGLIIDAATIRPEWLNFVERSEVLEDN